MARQMHCHTGEGNATPIKKTGRKGAGDSAFASEAECPIIFYEEQWEARNNGRGDSHRG